MEDPPGSKRSTFVIEDFSSTAKLAGSQTLTKSEEALGEYDPFGERKIEHPNTNMGAMAHLLKSSLGSGILAMPLAFRNAGLIFGMIGTIIVGYICTHCVQILVCSSHTLCRRKKVPSLGFAETAEAAFSTGPVAIRKYSNIAKIVAAIVLASAYIGTCTTYTSFLANTFKQVVDHYFEDNGITLRGWIGIMFLPLVLICLIRELKYLVPFSTLANLFIVISFTITLYYIFADLPPIEDRETFADASLLPLFFATVIFAMEGIGTVMPIENSMQDPRKFVGCPGVLNTAMIVVVVLYGTIGFFGYWKYGNDTMGSVTLNLPKDEILAQCVKILIAIAIYFTYPLQFIVPTGIVWGIIEPKIKRPEYKLRIHYLQRVLTVGLTVVLGILIPNLGPIISLVGAVCFSLLGLFLPAAIETVCLYEHGLGRFRWRLWKNIILMVFAIFGLLAGSYVSISDIFAGRE